MAELPKLGQGWAELYLRLRLQTEGQLRRMVWRGDRGTGLLEGTAEDLIHTVYLKFLDGSRAWDPNRTPFENFRSAISGEISNRATAAAGALATTERVFAADTTEEAQAILDRVESELADIEKRTERLMHHYGL